MLEILVELLIQIVGESLLDILVHLGKESGRVTRTVLLMLLFALLGAVFGGISLAAFPTHFIRRDDLRLASLIVTPIVSGVLFALLGRRRLRKGKPASALEEFWPAYSFALSMALVRHLGAE